MQLRSIMLQDDLIFLAPTLSFPEALFYLTGATPFPSPREILLHSFIGVVIVEIFPGCRKAASLGVYVPC